MARSSISITGMHSTHEVQRRTGLTYRQLDDLARKGVLDASVLKADGKGSRRLYSERDIAILCAAALLRKAGVVRGPFISAMKALKHKFNAAKVDDQFLCVTSNHAEIMDHSKLSALLRTTKRALTVIPLELLREKAEATT